MKNICIIPARGGSKRIPRKNIKEFLGKPIIAYSIEAALKSGLFDEVMVSTDDEEIAAIAKQYGAKVPFLRSAETANDFATMEDVIEEVLLRYKVDGMTYDHICCILSTAPFLTANSVSESFKTFEKSGMKSLVPVLRFSYPVQRCLRCVDGCLMMREPEHIHSRSQDLEPMYHDAGLFYWMKYEDFLAEKEFFSSATAMYELPEIEVQDIDTMEDWKIAEMKYKILHADAE